MKMFGILFGWSKASKCKKAIKRARCRLGLLKNKRLAIARQLRKDLAELIQSGHEETAFNRVEQLMEDESLAAAYELLDHFCEFILTHLSYIRRHKDCPNDINEAVSSLIFASARCGELPELGVIRKLFGQRYGERFATTAVELFPGNLVNKQLKESLLVKSVPNDLKYRMVDKIARDNCHPKQVLAIQYYPNWQQVQVKENKEHQLVESDAQIIDTIAGSKFHPSEIEEIKSDVICVNSSISKPSDSCSLLESSLADTSVIVSAVQQYPSYILRYPLEKKVKEIDFPELLSSINFDLQSKGERVALTSSAERASFSPYPEEMVDCVNDIKEFSVLKDGACHDQVLFKFRSSFMSRAEKTQFGYDISDMDQDESGSDNSSTKTSRKSKRKHEKRSRRRSTSLENLGLMDIGYMIYYHNPCKSPLARRHSTHYHRKHQKKPSLEGIPPPSYCQKRLMLHSFSEEGKVLHSCHSKGGTRRKTFNFNLSCCSLDQPCYFCLYNDEDHLEAQQLKQKRGIRATHVLHDECCHCQPFWDDEFNQGVELVALPKRPNRRSYSCASDYHVLNYPHCQACNGNNETKEKISASSKVSNTRISGSSTKIEAESTYSRAMTMPQERHRNSNDKMLRTFSCPSPHPNHVHPKLPDYDNIAAKFTALKREHLENMDCSRDRNK